MLKAALFFGVALLATSAAESAGTPPIGDCSGSMTTGGTAQLVISAAQNKHGYLLQVGVNDSNSDPLYFSDTIPNPGAGVAGSKSLNPSSTTAAGGAWSSPPGYPVNLPVYVNMATTGDKFKCNFW